ncbi:hypothetical protein [Proteiniborus sp.]
MKDLKTRFFAGAQNYKNSLPTNNKRRRDVMFKKFTNGCALG